VSATEIIRTEDGSDIGAIRAVHVSAFPTASEAELVERLRETGNLCVSLVAELDSKIVGHVAFSPVTLEPAVSDVRAVGLAPVAVVPAHQRQGIGARLIEAGIAACREAEYTLVVVLGHPTYYPRFGFQPASRLGIGNEYGADEAFMAIELVPGMLAGYHGLARYGPEFAGLE